MNIISAKPTLSLNSIYKKVRREKFTKDVSVHLFGSSPLCKNLTALVQYKFY